MKNPFPAPPLHAHPFTPLPLHFFSHSLTTRRAKALTPGEQSLLLALCLNVKNTNPRDGLTNEEMSPFVDAVLEAPKDWAVQTTALLTQVMNPQWRVHTHTHTHSHSHTHTHLLRLWPVLPPPLPPPLQTRLEKVKSRKLQRSTEQLTLIADLFTCVQCNSLGAAVVVMFCSMQVFAGIAVLLVVLSLLLLWPHASCDADS